MKVILVFMLLVGCAEINHPINDSNKVIHPHIIIHPTR